MRWDRSMDVISTLLKTLQDGWAWLEQSLSGAPALAGIGMILAGVGGLILVIMGLIGLIRRKHFRPDAKILFVHTGGAPSLFAYQSVLAS